MSRINYLQTHDNVRAWWEKHNHYVDMTLHDSGKVEVLVKHQNRSRPCSFLCDAYFIEDMKSGAGESCGRYEDCVRDRVRGKIETVINNMLRLQKVSLDSFNRKQRSDFAVSLACDVLSDGFSSGDLDQVLASARLTKRHIDGNNLEHDVNASKVKKLIEAIEDFYS